MAISKPVRMAATSVMAIIISTRVKPRVENGRPETCPTFFLLHKDVISRLHNAAAERFERKGVAGLAIHPPDFELDAVNHPLAGRGSGRGFKRLHHSAPSHGGTAGERGIEQ